MMSMTVRVPEEIYAKISEMAAREKITPSEVTRRVIVGYFVKEDVTSPPATEREDHMFRDFKEFNWRLKKMGGADKSLEAGQLTPSICVAFYEFFRAGRYGCGVEVDSK